MRCVCVGLCQAYDTSGFFSRCLVTGPLQTAERRASHKHAGPSATATGTPASRLEAFLSGRKGLGSAAVRKQPSNKELTEQQKQLQQQRLLERKLKKQFMSSKVCQVQHLGTCTRSHHLLEFLMCVAICQALVQLEGNPTMTGHVLPRACMACMPACGSAHTDEPFSRSPQWMLLYLQVSQIFNDVNVSALMVQQQQGEEGDLTREEFVQMMREVEKLGE